MICDKRLDGCQPILHPGKPVFHARKPALEAVDASPKMVESELDFVKPASMRTNRCSIIANCFATSAKPDSIASRRSRFVGSRLSIVIDRRFTRARRFVKLFDDPFVQGRSSNMASPNE
jgi:hypothetical protein